MFLLYLTVIQSSFLFYSTWTLKDISENTGLFVAGISENPKQNFWSSGKL